MSFENAIPKLPIWCSQFPKSPKNKKAREILDNHPGFRNKDPYFLK